MSFFDSWTFRTERPEFQVDDELELYVSGYDDGDGSVYARIGNTKLRIDSDDKRLIDRKITAKVTSFDKENSSGEATLLEVGSEAEF